MSNINPVRLYNARISRALTIEQLAEKIDVTKQTISNLENGKNNAEFKTLNALSEALNYPTAFFFGKDDNMNIGNTYFRALYSSKKIELNEQKIKTSYIAFIKDCLSEYINFKPLNLPKIDKVNDIETFTQLVRDYWGLGLEPINNMVYLLESNGIIVSEFSTKGKKIDAFYQYGEIEDEEYYCVVLGTDKSSFTRRQFNAAHELGHILMHRKDYDFDVIDRKDFRSRESEANQFASAFLLPKDPFINDVKRYPNKLNHYVELKKKWKVSISAMIIRAFHLNVISENQYQYLMRQLSKKGWRAVEPFDESWPVKQPKALIQAIHLLVLNNHFTPEQIFDLFEKHGMRLPKDIVDEILNLDPSILSEDINEEYANNIVQFNVNFNSTDREND